MKKIKFLAAQKNKIMSTKGTHFKFRHGFSKPKSAFLSETVNQSEGR